MEWIKRHVRGTVVHRAWRRLRGRATSLEDLNSAYDRQTIAVMKRVLRRDSNCIDVGAHRGDILQHMTRIAPAGTHHAFEALPHLAEALRERFPRATVHACAVADVRGESEFQFVTNAPGYSGLRRRIYDRPDPEISTIRVQVVTLDEAIPPSLPIHFIKLDIEGGEYHALRGASQILRRWKPVVVLEAGAKSTGQYGVTPNDLFELLVDSHGYQLSTMARWLRGEPPYSRHEFAHNWDNGPDYYFIASAPGRSGR